MRHTTILLLAFTFIFSYVQGQTPLTANQKRISHWYFGLGNHLWWDANGNVHADTTSSPMHVAEGGGTICDTLGNVLFFTDGDTVWNKNMQPMLNGTGLMGCGNWGSSSQNGLIIQMPENDSLYYIFTTDCWDNAGAAGLRYSMVNLKGDGGLGEVIQKNVLLQAPCTEGLAATFHANGKDVWLMAHGYNTNTYDCYKITKNGIQLPPISSYITSFPTDFFGWYTFSNKGDLFVGCSTDTLTSASIYRFDKENGILYDRIKLPIGGMKIVFSPDDTKLYTTTGGIYLYQICIYTYNFEAIHQSAQLVYYNPLIDNNIYQPQLGPDGKVYITRFLRDSIAIIENPNNYGLSCNVNINNNLIMNGYSINANPYLSFSFGEYLQSYNYIPNLIPNACDSTYSILYTPKLLHQAKMYPNPVYQDYVTLELNKSLPRCPQKFYLVDMQGKKYELKVYMQSLDKFRLSTEHIPQGMYILHIPEYPDIIHKIIISQP